MATKSESAEPLRNPRKGERPTPDQLRAAHGRRVADVIAPKLAVLFCGINPSLYSAAVGHHFARPGNRFYKTLHRAGFTPRLLAPHEERELLPLRIGITNLVPGATASAAEIDPMEYARGASVLARKIARTKPGVVAFLGIDAYRRATGNRDAKVGRQSTRFADTETWVLPNPSGLNAHYQLDDLARVYRKLRHAIR